MYRQPFEYERIDKLAKPLLEIYAITPIGDDFKWRAFSDDKNYPVEKFENAKIFDNKSFWEIENEIEWVDD